MLQRKNLGEPDEVIRVGKGRIEITKLAGLSLGRGLLEPGWRWSEDAGPIAGTPSCQATHTAVVLSGRMHVRMDDGSEMDLAPGDAHVVSAGHDAWVVGDEQLVTLDVLALEPAEPAQQGPANGAQTIACPCGVSFSVAAADELDHLIGAVQEHGLRSHGQEVSREQLTAQLNVAPTRTAEAVG